MGSTAVAPRLFTVAEDSTAVVASTGAAGFMAVGTAAGTGKLPR
ncbi:MAG TPA: hypothetical protein VHX49_15560 [Candidatus Acidoferrales bacterium]|nr:hypothetical protein [Candidatus Acidoferrales bacterium]